MRISHRDWIVHLIILAVLASFVFADNPSGSMVIYGPNGTEVTGTRSVMLNLTFSSSDGIGSCRWANDAEADLALQPWEPCTTVKAWLLSGNYANKTVYFQVRDNATHTATFNDSIIYRYTQDYTPPEALVVYDGLIGDDIDWWNSNDTLHAHWTARDDISVMSYAYRILNNSACFGTCGFTNVSTNTSVTVTGLSLVEGRSFSFEVVAYNPFGLNKTVISDGATIDLTDPSSPVINSSTHPLQNRPYDESEAIFNFTSTDSASGIAGYSYLLDRHPGTAPDNIVEERQWETLAELHRGSFNQTLKVNGSGASDYAYAVFSQLHNNFTVNDSVRVRVALAEQFNDYRDLMGVKVYLAKIGDGVDITSFNMESAAISNIANFSWDIKYAESMADATVYQFNLTVNETISDATSDIYVVVSGILTDDNNREPFAISGTTTLSLVDNTTKSFVCNENNACSQNTNTLDYAIGVSRLAQDNNWTVRYDLLGDAVYYFHAKAKDNAGNWGETGHYRFEVAAGGVNSLIYSPFDGELFMTNTTATNITVKVSVSGNASVRVVAKHPDGSNYTSPAYIFNSSHDFQDITLELGQNEIYALANTSAGALSASSSVFVTVASGYQPYMNKTLRIRYAGCTQSSPAFLCNRVEPLAYVGIATENAASITAPSVTADTSVNSLKIYMTRVFDTGAIASQFSQNMFMDRVQPMFGYTRDVGDYVIRQALRYNDVYLGGEFLLPPGTYQFHMRKGGLTTDGRFNITITLE
jgi:hypothetical protein